MQKIWKPSVGVLLLDAQMRPVYHTPEAASILEYPRAAGRGLPLEKILPLTRPQLSATPKPAGGEPAAPPEFRSGRRRYRCQAFTLDASGYNGIAVRGDGDRHQPKFVVVLERVTTQAPDITRWSEMFQLTTRECETVRFLLKGLTSKEIGDQMNISPNTVKAFLKLVMAKVGATNRTGIVAKILEGAGPLDTSYQPEPLLRAALGTECLQNSDATNGSRRVANSAARR